MTRRSYSGGAAPTTLSSPITTSDGSATIVSSTGYPDGTTGPFVIVIDKGSSTEEKILVASRSGTSLVFQVRGYDGTVSQNHSASAPVEHCISAIDLDEANAHVNTTTGVHGLAAGDNVVGRTATQTLANKTITGPSADMVVLRRNGDDVVTRTTSETLSNKTLVSPNMTGTAQASVLSANVVLVGGDPVATLEAGQTLSNKVLQAPSLVNPTISGPVITGGSLDGTTVDGSVVANVSGVQTLTNKTLTSPVLDSPVLHSPDITWDTGGPVYAKITSSSGLTSGTTALTVVTAPTFTPAANGTMVARFSARNYTITGSGGGETYEVQIRVNGATVAATMIAPTETLEYGPVGVLQAVFDVAAGNPTTVSVSVQRTLGTGSIVIAAQASAPATLTVEPFQ